MKQIRELPKGWKFVKLGKLITQDIKNGYSPNCPDEPNGSWILSLGNLTDNGFDPHQAKPAPLNDKKMKDFLLNSGDFLISRSNTLDKVGRTILFKGELENCSYPDLLMRFRVNEEQVVNDFLNDFLRSPMVRKYIQSCASGTSNSMVKINKKAVENIPVILPALPEQKAIADLLSTWDDAIEKTGRLIQAKEKWFKRLLHSLACDHCSLDNEKSYWKKVKLGEVCKVITSNVDKKTTPGEKLVRLCNYMDVYKNYYITSDLDFMVASATLNEIDKYQLKVHDVLLTKDSETPEDIANSACVLEASGNLLCGYHLTILRPEKQLFGPYLNFVLNASRIRYAFSRQANGATRFGLSLSAYDMIEIPLPPIEEQQQIAETLSSAQQEIDLLKQLAEKYKTQKRGLMQKLLTGEWRVKPEIVNQYKEA